ncbi:MAG: diguanylate cyclase [Pirellulales bacterium]|nr:diguanylate cyclase [Pirellulales bacterium]
MYVFYVLTIAFANLALGYGTAVYLRRGATAGTLDALASEDATRSPSPITAAAAPAATPQKLSAFESAETIEAASSKSRSALLGETPNATGETVCSSLIQRSVFEEMIAGWRADDPLQERSATLGLIAVDQIAEVRKTQGDDVGDRLMKALADVIDDTIRKPRGTDAATYYDRDRFGFFFGDTTPQEATHAMERLRLSIAQGRYVLGRETITLTASCSAVGMLRGEADELLLARLEFAARQASILGGNRTCLDAGHGPVPIDPIAIDVPERTVLLNP